MQYWVWLTKNGEPYLFEDSFLDFIPNRIFDLMEVSQVPEKLGLCEHCELDAVCHVMQEIENRPGVYRKLCSILFHDTVKPKWKLSELV